MHTISFEIDHLSEKYGWMDCWLTIDGIRHHLDASDVYPPFLPLLYFLRAVRGQRFPARLVWEEEGPELELLATAVSEDSPLMLLKIRHTSFDSENNSWPEETWFEDTIDREVFIQAFLPALIHTCRYLCEPLGMWHVPEEEVWPVLEAIKGGLPPRSDISSPQNVTIKISKGYPDGLKFFILNGYEDVYFHPLMDGDPFLQDLIDFLIKVNDGNLPAEFEHHRFYETSDDNANQITGWELIRFRAEALPVEENFRLIFYDNHFDEQEFMLLNEVVNRQLFADRFAASLKQLLQTGEPIFKEQNEKVFGMLSNLADVFDRKNGL
jgi:hypothetical protein